MKNDISSVLNKIESNGYSAYVIGGYVRDKLLNKESYDIDIATSALPKDLVKIFNIPYSNSMIYGNVKIVTKKYRFDITTFRKEISYNGRKPEEIKYVKELSEDLKRRDFTINTIAMDKNGNIIDLANGIDDLNEKVIKCVGDANLKFKEDPLRILRAIRFSIVLDFKLDKYLLKCLKKNMKLVKTLSKNRIKEELSKILVSQNCIKGLEFMKKIGILKYMGISYKKIIDVDDINGMYAQIKFSDDYNFTKEEKNNINIIKNIVSYGKIDNTTLYNYGLYLCMVAGKILGLDQKEITMKYNSLPIKSNKELKITFNEIKSITNIENPSVIKGIIKVLINNVLNNEINNDKDSLTMYIINKSRK